MLLNTFDNRLKDGKMGEAAFMKALELQIIPNDGYGEGPTVTETEWNDARWEQIMENKVNGDVWFISKEDGRKKYVDVKNTQWVADASLEHFRTDDSYYFFNAWSLDRNMYYMVRADQKFKDFAKSRPVSMRGKASGREVYFTDLPSLEFHSGNGAIFEFDPIAYKSMVVDLYDYCNKNGIEYKIRILR